MLDKLAAQTFVFGHVSPVSRAQGNDHHTNAVGVKRIKMLLVSVSWPKGPIRMVVCAWVLRLDQSTRQWKVVSNRHQGKDMNSEGEKGDDEIKQDAAC